MNWRIICRAYLRAKRNLRRFGQPRRFFFYPKGALTHHLTVGQMVVLPAEVVRSFSGGQQTR